jgi:tetratricopeptide (TPR) repeat protein
MKRTGTLGLVLAAAVALAQAGIIASGGSVPTAGPSGGGGGMRSLSPEEMAKEAYNSGISHKDKGLKIEDKDPAKAKGEYEKAFKDFQKAVKLSPELYQAYNGLGFSSRKMGDYAKALDYYDKALALAPGFPDAIEYRGEAYLAMNRIDDAKASYLQLFSSDRQQADVLMKSMTTWVEKRKAEPAGVDPAALASFESWIKERGALAGQTASMALSAPSHGWK